MFKSVTILPIKALGDGKDLYQLVVLSHINYIKAPQVKDFPRVGYKYIKFTKIT